MIEHVLDTAPALSARSRSTVVVGHQARRREVRAGGAAGLTFVVQEPQLGTAHALLTAEPALRGRDRNARPAVGRRAAPVAANAAERWSIATSRPAAAATVVTAVVDDPHGYGRIVRSGERIARIVEERDATPGRAGDPRDQSGHLRLRARRAVRRGPRHRRRERAARVLPARPRGRSTGSAAAAWKR